MTELTDFLLFNAKTTKQREKNNLLLLKENNNSAALIGINLYCVLFSISWMLNMPIVPENKALFVIFVYYVSSFLFLITKIK